MTFHARSNVVNIDQSEFKDVVAEWRIGQIFQVATVVLLVYDILITFDKEVKYFWKIPRGLVNQIYFVNRYVGTLGAVASASLESLNATLALCNFSLWTMSIANWITTISIDYILMIRVLALYSQDKSLSMCLKTLLVLAAISKLGMIIYLNILEQFVMGVLADVSVCGQTALISWRLGMVDWLIPLIYETLLMFLALYKAVEYWRMSAGLKEFKLVKVLVEDQIIYFVLVISCSVFAILGFKLQFSNIFLANVIGQLGNPSLFSLLGSRMLFNLKEAAERDQNGGTSYQTPSRTVSGMNFAEPVYPQRESGATHSGSEQVA